jgi:glutamate 5-kinase
MNMKERPTIVKEKQAAAAVGQSELMSLYGKFFSQYGKDVAQLLLTKNILDNEERKTNAINAFDTLFKWGVVPIINENDSVTFDEISIGDNDNLSALTAILWSADLLVLFSDIDGVYTDNPKSNPDAKLVELVDDVEKLKANITIGATNSFGTGGIATKLEAAVRATEYGIPMILANGSHSQVLQKLSDGSEKATLFLGK